MRLKDADISVLEGAVIKEVEKEQHIHLFNDRKRTDMKCRPSFKELLKDGLDEFCSLYGWKCVTGSQRQLRLLVEWTKFCASFVVETPTKKLIFKQLIEGFDEISEDTKSAVISAVLAALYNCLVHQINMILENLKSQWEFAVYKPPDVVTPDDDVALYRLFGFSLHASISYHTQACSVKRYTAVKKHELRKELKLLNLLLESDKTVIPAILKIQDRGRMKFPSSILLPFCRLCSTEIKMTLNMTSFQKCGCKISKVS